MGDRCYLSIIICGHIETIEAYQKVTKAIKDEFFLNIEDISLLIRQAVENGTNVEFELNEVNYGNIAPLETVLILHRIDFLVYHDDGSSYPGGYRAYFSSTGAYYECVASHGDVVFYLSRIKDAIESQDPRAYLLTLLEDSDKARGAGLPKLSLGHEVRGWLAIGGPNLETQHE
jgi:hypothetical protein